MLSISQQRHGVTALLAMIFLVLFATLAVGFYASTTQTTVIATNEKNGVISLTAAESAKGYPITMGIFGVIAIVLFLVCFANTRERIRPPREQKTKLSGDLGRLFHNPRGRRCPRRPHR